LQQRLIIFFFFALNLAVVGFSIFGEIEGFQREKSQAGKDLPKSRSYFIKIKYYSLSDAIPQLDLVADELILVDGNSEITFFSPIGVSYGEDGQELNFKGKLGRYTESDQILTISKGAHLFNESTDLKCVDATYRVADELAICEKDVKSNSVSSRTGDKLDVKADYLESKLNKQLTTYKGNVVGKVTRKRRYEYPINFKADNAVVNLVSSVVDLNDNVSLKQQGVTATSRRGEIFLENYNKKLKYFVLSDDVVVKEKVVVQEPEGPREFLRTALSERLEGVTSEEILVLTGYPKVYQMNDVIRGNRIILRRDSELVEVEDANTLFYMNNTDGKK
jgi:lipopolysaccharide export system protein LptA